MLEAVAALEEAGELASKASISTHASLDPEIVGRTLKRLVEAGFLEGEQIGGYGEGGPRYFSVGEFVDCLDVVRPGLELGGWGGLRAIAGVMCNDRSMRMTGDMKRVVDEQRLGFIATVTPDGRPNLSPKGTTAVLDDSHLLFADLASPNTVCNLAENPHIEINVVDPIVRKGYRFRGTATVHTDDHDHFYDRGLAALARRGSSLTADRVRSIVVVEVVEVVRHRYLYRRRQPCLVRVPCPAPKSSRQLHALGCQEECDDESCQDLQPLAGICSYDYEPEPFLDHTVTITWIGNECEIKAIPGRPGR